jgi:hypothetical protein
VGSIFLKETVKFKKDSSAEEDPLLSGKNDKGALSVDANDNDHASVSCLTYFRSREIIVCSVMYAILGYYKIMMDEVFSLWAPQDKSIGGLNFQSNDIGILYAVAGAAGLVSQFFIFPPLMNKLGPLNLFRLTSIGMIVVNCTMPLGNIMVSNTWAVWLFLCINFVLNAFASNMVFVSIMVLINNSSPLSTMGAVNGFAQTWTSLLRSVAPTVGSNVLSWSLTNGLSFPFNFYFTFFFIGFFALLCFILTFLLDKNSIDHRKPNDYKLSLKIIINKFLE